MRVKRARPWCRQAAELTHIKAPTTLIMPEPQHQGIIIVSTISEDIQETLPDIIIEQAAIRIMTEQRRNIIIPIPIGVIPTQCVREAQVHELLPEAELVLENKEKRRRARI